MLKHRLECVAVSALLLLVFPSIGLSAECENLPPPNPSQGFLQNFLKPCYALPLIQTQGTRRAGDKEAIYDMLQYVIDPRYEAIVIAEFPQARYLSYTAYDDHRAIVDWIRDDQLIPALGPQGNPFLPGGVFTEDQLYVVTLDFGGLQPEPEAVTPGCGEPNLDLRANVLKAFGRHAGMSWNGDPNLPQGLPLHEDTTPSAAGYMTVRRFLQGPDGGNKKLATPLVIYRDLSTGCAVPTIDVVQNGLVTYSAEQGAAWLNKSQIDIHTWIENAFIPTLCHAVDGQNKLVWFRHGEYIRGDNVDAGYLRAMIPVGIVPALIQNELFMRLRFKLPVTPKECTQCPANPVDDMRYWSLSFSNDMLATIDTVYDGELVADPLGYVNLIVGFGAEPPAHVDASNYYTYLDLSAIEGFEALRSLTIRNILTGPEFRCRISDIPYHTGEHHGAGGYLGDYTPVVDYLFADQIPLTPEAMAPSDSCGLPAPEPRNACLP